MESQGVDDDIYLQILTNTKQKVIDKALKECIKENTDKNDRAHYHRGDSLSGLCTDGLRVRPASYLFVFHRAATYKKNRVR